MTISMRVLKIRNVVEHDIRNKKKCISKLILNAQMFRYVVCMS